MTRQREFKFFLGNTAAGFRTVVEWCTRKAGCEPQDLHAVLEATGPYHEAAALALYEAQLKVSVVNPARIKHFAQSLGIKAKNDRQDAATIARYGQQTPLRPWKPEAPEYRQLRALLHRLEAVLADLQRERNRREKARVAAASPEVLQSLERMIGFLEQEKRDLEAQIEQHIESHSDPQKDRALLESIPGIGPVVSSWFVLLLKHGQSFDAAPQAAAYLGLTPTEHQSGQSSILLEIRVNPMSLQSTDWTVS